MAEPRVLRMSSIAPEGTAWARELHALARDVEANTGGQLRIKWYLGSIAGDEPTTLQKVRRGELEGFAGGIGCTSIAPSLRALRIPGLIHDRGEEMYVLRRMQEDVSRELRDNGFTELTMLDLGFDVIFSNQPVASLDDFRRGRYWMRNIDPVFQAMLKAIGVHVVTSAIESAAETVKSQRLDGLITFPTAALAFQWSPLVKQFNPMPLAFWMGCVIVSNEVFDGLPPEQQRTLRSAADKSARALDDITRSMDEALLGGLFKKQGLQRVTPTTAFEREYVAAGHAARQRLVPRLVPAQLLENVDGWLREYRAQAHNNTR